jgi:hypothetical protein
LDASAEHAEIGADDLFGFCIGLRRDLVIHVGLRDRLLRRRGEYRTFVVGDVDFHIGRQAHAQGMLVELVIVQRNADGHALNDLDPVACRVLRRQQREHAACACTQANHLAVIFDAAAVNIRRNVYRLTNADMAQLIFLEVRVDPQVVQRNDRHQLLTGRDAATQLHATLRDVTGDGRNDCIALCGDPCGAEIRTRLQHGWIVGNVRTFHRCARRLGLCLRLIQRRTRLRNAIAHVLHDFRRFGLRGDEWHMSLQIGFGLAQIDFTRRHGCIGTGDGIRLLAHLAHRLCKRAAGLT